LQYSQPHGPGNKAPRKLQKIFRELKVQAAVSGSEFINFLNL
jgi:hypothetical protein